MNDLDFERNLLFRLENDFSPEQLKIIRQQLITTLQDYNISEKTDKEKTMLSTDVWTLNDEVKFFLMSKKLEGRTSSTLGIYADYLKHFFSVIQKNVKDITTNDIRKYLYDMAAHGRKGNPLAESTVDNIRLILNSFFSWCQTEGIITLNPCGGIHRIKAEKKERQSLSEMQLEIIKDTCREISPWPERDLAIIEFLYSTGARVSECINTNIEDINFMTREVKIFGKGKKHRTVYLNDRAIYRIQKYLKMREGKDTDPSLFVSYRGHHRLSIRGIQKILKEISSICNIPCRPHLIRHTMATDALKHGMPITSIQTLLGHESLNTTMIYAHTFKENIKYDHIKYIS